MAETVSTLQMQMLGDIGQQLASGQYDHAQLICSQLIAQIPACFEAHVIMSKLLYRGGQIRAATRYAMNAYRLVGVENPIDQKVALCSHLLLLGEEESAFELIRHLTSTEAGEETLLFNIALHLNALGKQHEALACLRQADKPWTSSPAINQLIATILGNMGSRQTAADHIEKVIEVQPLNGQVQWTLSFLNLPDGANQRIARMLEAIHTPGIDRVQLQLFHYALFREYDRAQEVEKAWSHLAAASELRRKEIFHSSDLESRHFDALVEASKSIPDYQPHGIEDKLTPIFVLGMPRTGTSLLEKILGNFRQVQPCGELAVFRTQLLWQLDQNMQIPFDFTLAKKLANVDLRQLGQRYLERIAWRGEGAAYLVDKEPFNYNFAGLIAKALPSAKIIHLMRNPMDTCFSNLKEGFAPSRCTYSYTQEEVASHYLNYRRLMRHWHEIAPGRILDVQYENLVTHPEQEAERIRLFCGLQAHADKTEVERRQYVSSTLSSIQLLEPIHDKNINAWQRYQNHLGVLEKLLAKEQEDYQGLIA